MSCFTICDGYDCNGNESENEMFNIDINVRDILENSDYVDDDRILNLCDYCIKKISQDDDFNTILAINEYDEIVTIEDEPDAVQLKDYDFK